MKKCPDKICRGTSSGSEPHLNSSPQTTGRLGSLTLAFGRGISSPATRRVSGLARPAAAAFAATAAFTTAFTATAMGFRHSFITSFLVGIHGLAKTMHFPRYSRHPAYSAQPCCISNTPTSKSVTPHRRNSSKTAASTPRPRSTAPAPPAQSAPPPSCRQRWEWPSAA